MKYAHLGRTGVTVSRLCLGTMNFGTQTTEPDSFALMDKALELGINFFDCANVYGGKVGEGITEQILGRWFAQGGRRDNVVLTTKVDSPMGRRPNQRGSSAYHIRQACEESLRRLQTDRIDVYFLHHVDRGESTPLGKTMMQLPDVDLYRPPYRKDPTRWDEIFQALDVLVRQGKVLYVGTSNVPAWYLAQGCEKASARGLLGPVCQQSLYNLAQRTVELEVVPACREYVCGLIPYSPLAGGLLGGALAKALTGRRAGLGDAVAKHRAALEGYEALCRQLGESPADVALAWLLANPVVTGPIIGPRTLDQLTASLRALDIQLDAATLKTLDTLWPGPGGESPEAYAW